MNKINSSVREKLSQIPSSNRSYPDVPPPVPTSSVTHDLQTKAATHLELIEYALESLESALLGPRPAGQSATEPVPMSIQQQAEYLATCSGALAERLQALRAQI